MVWQAQIQFPRDGQLYQHLDWELHSAGVPPSWQDLQHHQSCHLSVIHKIIIILYISSRSGLCSNLSEKFPSLCTSCPRRKIPSQLNNKNTLILNVRPCYKPGFFREILLAGSFNNPLSRSNWLLDLNPFSFNSVSLAMRQKRILGSSTTNLDSHYNKTMKNNENNAHTTNYNIDDIYDKRSL